MRVGMRRWGKRFTNECRRIDREWTLEWNKRKTYNRDESHSGLLYLAYCICSD